MLIRRLGALATVALLAACSGGGTTPASPPAVPVTASAKPTAPPASSARTSVGTARITLKLPQALRAKGAAVHARNAAAVAKRMPKFVDPGDGTVNSGDVLDIYVDNTLIANMDGNFPNNDHSIVVTNPNGDGTLAETLPLYSTNNNTIVAVEWNNSGAVYIMAIGETNQGAITAGSTTNVSLTMQMQAYYVGIVDLPNFNDPEILLGQNYYASASGTPNNANGDGQWACTNPAAANAFGLYTADAGLTFVPIGGYGGTSSPVVTSSPIPGQSHLATSPLGTYFAAFDAGCTNISVNVSAPNPANAIYTDVANGYPLFVTGGSHVDYRYYDGYYGGYAADVNQGIWNLWWIGYNGLGNSSVYQAFNQLSNPTTGSTGYPGIDTLTIVGNSATPSPAPSPTLPP